MAITTYTDTEIDCPATIIHPIYSPLAMVEQSSRLAVEAMQLKDQTPESVNPWSGVSSKGTVTSIASLVVVNDGKEQTH